MGIAKLSRGCLGIIIFQSVPVMLPRLALFQSNSKISNYEWIFNIFCQLQKHAYILFNHNNPKRHEL